MVRYTNRRRVRKTNRRVNRSINRYTRKSRLPNPLGARVLNTMKKLRLNFTYMIPIRNAIAVGAQIIPTTYCLNYPGIFVNQLGTRVTMGSIAGSAAPTNYPRFFGGNGAFDQYKVLRLKVAFMPSEQETRTSATNYDAVDSPGLVYVYRDYDDSANLSSEGNALNQGLKPKSFVLGKPIYWTMVQAPENRNKYLNAQSATIDFTNPQALSENNIANPAASFKTLLICGPQSANVGIVGRMYVTWDVIFRGIHADP